MNKKVIIGITFILEIVTLTTWDGNVMGKGTEMDNSVNREVQNSSEEIYVVEPEQEMVQVDRKNRADEEQIIYELTEEEEKLGLKFNE